MAELGNTLSRARRARGITLEDAERDTHVSRRYLSALESEDFGSFPAPVYARGFLRTYSRYLGLNPDELIRVFPNNDLTVDLAPLPSVSRPPGQAINANWVVAALVAIFLIGAAALLWSSGSDTTTLSDQTRREETLGAQNSNPGVIAPPPAAPLATIAAGKAIGPVTAGVAPDLVGADMPSVVAALSSNGFEFVIIQGASATVPRGIVIGQSPAAGSRTNGETLTVVVSRGP
jgi:transcriptional regulator with XRE-family HTH domain